MPGMTEEQYEAREAELKRAVAAQEKVAYDALLAYQEEVRKLDDLKRQLRWLPVERQGGVE